MRFFKQIAEKQKNFLELKKSFKNSEKIIQVGLSACAIAHYIYALTTEYEGTPILVLCETESEAFRLFEDINTFSKERIAALFPEKDINLTDKTIEVTNDYELGRLSVLSSAVSLKGNIKVITASVEAACQFTLPPKTLIDNILTIKPGDSYKISHLCEKLISLGYSYIESVNKPGRFAKRGGILDVFTPFQEAVRIEFFGDEIDTISSFDIETQRRIGSLVEVVIPPCKELLFSDEFVENLSSLAKKREDKELLSCLKKIKEGVFPTNSDRYVSLCYKGFHSLFDYIKKIIIIDYSLINSAYENILMRYNDELTILFEKEKLHGLIKDSSDLILKKTSFIKELDKKSQILFSQAEFLRNRKNQFPEAKIINSGCNTIPHWSGDFDTLIEELTEYINEKITVCIFAGSEKAAQTLAFDLYEKGLPADYVIDLRRAAAGRIYVFSGNLSFGISYPEVGIVFMTRKGGGISKNLRSENLYKNTLSNSQSSKKKKGGFKSLTDVSIGDYVVHQNYGIGIFEGVVKLKPDGVTRDYIKLKYAGKDSLYIPVNQLDCISKYIGSTDTATVKLTKLGSDSWSKAKSRTKASLEEFAEELIQLYQKRAEITGVSFPKDDERQVEFESRFPYIETDDQQKSISEIKADMEASRPMDRLLCGDVGFGKTEVALRAAFKAVCAGKQCALLCPTTVLAWQHYNTALNRSKGVTVHRKTKNSENSELRIEFLSRFRTAAQSREILKRLATGEIDFIIGTHKIISKSIKFKELGLLIIDEEQRFGVSHKEKLRENFPFVDTLTLSATPIPRTLNMAMSGLRDMSLLETPPSDRRPVTTYVCEQDYNIIASAIDKELKRDGQVYYVYNRIDGIELRAKNLREFCPNARIGIMHGRMEEEELLSIWKKLLEREIDVLVSTTIIETGIDVPNVNTLIIENADNMGLAQLHQLRGRVGRETRRAYAYFMFEHGKVVSETAQKRLNAIREFTKFGAGFHIAMRDLEIRGAGSVLGKNQSGHMSEVGYAMYVKMLEKAVNKAKNKTQTLATEEKSIDDEFLCLIDIQTDAYIPEYYIESHSDRIYIYRRISEIRTEEELQDVYDELIDRFGEPPKSVKGLMNVQFLRAKAQKAGISEINHKEDKLSFIIKDLQFKQLSNVNRAFKVDITKNPPHIIIKLKGGRDNPENPIKAAMDFVAMLMVE